MGDIDNAIERAGYEVVTKAPPKTPLAQMRLLLKAEKGSTKAVAGRLGVSQRTVERLPGRTAQEAPPGSPGGSQARGPQGVETTGQGAGPPARRSGGLFLHGQHNSGRC
jgi:hypothetical protein